mgnify:CR=1 FL=1
MRNGLQTSCELSPGGVMEDIREDQEKDWLEHALGELKRIRLRTNSRKWH